MNGQHTYYEGSALLLEGEPMSWALIVALCIAGGALGAVVLANVAIILRGV